MINTETVCIICLEEGRKIENRCDKCKSANMHNKCFKLMLSKDFDKCPTCRHIINLDKTNNTNITTLTLNLKIRNFTKRIIESNICIKINYSFLSLLFTFIIYIILGFVGCLINNKFPFIFSSKYLEFASILLLQILIFVCASCCVFNCLCNDNDDNF